MGEITKPPENLHGIRQQEELTRITKAEPEIETWLIQDYKEQDIGRELRNLENREAHGNDGIPGEEYKATRQWAIKPITKIMNLIKNGRPIPERWTEGTILYIYKNKGDSGECGDYRPICPSQIIYKIWSGQIARKLKKITHILTSDNQYGYEEGISTTDAIIKVEQYIEQADNKEKVLLMGQSKAFDTINRKLLWTTLYKKGLPGETIRRIRGGHRAKRLSPKYRWRYGEAEGNNIGFCQGSAISALLFII